MDHLPANVDVVRALSATPEFRDAAPGGDGTIGTLSGYFSAHDVWYEVESMWEGDFIERTAPGFAAESIAADRESMRVLFNHGFDTQVSDKVLGRIDVLEDRAQGPYYEVPLFDTSYNRDLLPGLRAGVYGASFRMRVTADSWDDEPKASDYNPKALPERSITRAKVMEFGPVTFPANPAASALVRSVTDSYYDRLRQRDQTAFDAAVRAAGRPLPDFTGRSDARSTDDGGGTTDDGPGNSPTSARTEAEARHHLLILKGVIHHG